MMVAAGIHCHLHHDWQSPKGIDRIVELNANDYLSGILQLLWEQFPAR
jgi:hypothetical protein